MSCSGDQHRFAPGATACNCGQTRSTLSATALPYPSWTLDEGSRRGTRHSSYASATDTRTGRPYLIREYQPDTVADPAAQRRRFIATAKSLRGSTLPAQRILFAYTRNGLCYTVADPPSGSPLWPAPQTGKTEHEYLSRLDSLLSALHQLHTAGALAGPLFHGNLRPENILATGSDTGALQLAHGLYLENVLRENQLTPEHFQQQDLLAAGDSILSLVQGFGSPADRLPRLQRIHDPVLGAGLEYLLGAHNARPSNAKAALDYLHLLQRALAGNDRQLLQQARGIFSSPRLLRYSTPPIPPPPPPHSQPSPPSPSTAAPPRFQPAPSPPPPPPPLQPAYTPVATHPPATPPQSRPAPVPKRRRSGCGGCLLTLLLAVLVVAAVIAILNRHAAVRPATLDFSAAPNPAPRKGRVQLRWDSSGFDRLELDGRRVDADGSLVVTANAPHRYTLIGIRPDGTRQVRTIDLDLQSRHAAKPSPGALLTSPPDRLGNPDQVSDEHSKTQPSPETRTPAQSESDTPISSEPQAVAPVVRQLPPSPGLQGASATVNRWAQAMLSNDPNREASFYAPQLDRYFLDSGVTQDFVRRSLAESRDRGSNFTQFNVSNLSTTPEPDGSVLVRFNKEVSLDTPTGPKHGAAHTILHLRQIDGAWKITSERDFRGPAPQP